MKNILIIAVVSLLILSGCSNDKQKSDAYGNFEAVETIVSSESSGKINELNVEEGQIIDADKGVGYIDTNQLYLKKLQLVQQKSTVRTKFKDVSAQISVLQEQEHPRAIREKERVERLLKDNAATGKQLDDINGNIDVINKQISSIDMQNSTTNEELKGLDVQINQIADQLQKSSITNPVKGTVIIKFAEQGEILTSRANRFIKLLT